MSNDLLTHILDKALLDKLERFRVKKKEESDFLMRWCTKPGCKGSMRGDSVDTERVTCPECHTVVCFKCKDEWHEGLSCETNAD